MRSKCFALFALLMMAALLSRAQQKKINAHANYLVNRKPLRANPYLSLPLGTIQAQGWLKEMLLRQKSGATGNLDSLYPEVMGKRNGWLGGDGDQWERGPYWIDGLLPLAYILHDTMLIAKTKPWIEWVLQSQQPNGYFGPSKDFGPEDGLQRDNSHDWWPKIVMLKILQQYYSATNDKRVIGLLTRYFRFQLSELPRTPLDHWSFWARYRAGDNLMVVYWLYNITGEAFLLQLADVLHHQTFDYTAAFLSTDLLSTDGSIHGVNLAEGMKEPALYYQQHPEKKYTEAMRKGFRDLDKFNGFVNGMYGGDESLHGNNPTQGSELCSAVEMMFTLENTLAVTGDIQYADRLERIAFNALPAQTTPDYLGRQYFQQPNQVMMTRHIRNFDVNHAGTDVCYGLLTGYPCCTANMHQGWPKFAQNLFYATPDAGLAALVYAPAVVNARVGDNRPVVITEKTNYPFEETIRFSIDLGPSEGSIMFPFSMRIPAWCDSASITINGQTWKSQAVAGIVRIVRTWNSGDLVELHLPMRIRTSKWYENSQAVERGPLVYALNIPGNKRVVKNTIDPGQYGKEYEEITPAAPWNFGLIDPEKNDLRFKEAAAAANFPWTIENAPSKISAKARRIPSWTLYNDMAGPQPFSFTYQMEAGDTEETIELVPYGCTQLRISEFPVLTQR